MSRAEPYVVRAEELAPVIQQALDNHYRHHPKNGYSRWKHKRNGAPVGVVHEVGATKWLAFEAQTAERSILSITRGERQIIGLELADKIVRACGHTFDSAGIEVIKNPRLSQKGWEKKMRELGCEPIDP